MEELINQIKQLQNSPIREVINSRLGEFKKLGQENSNEIFKELCFCLMTANFSAERSIKIQQQINSDFLFLAENILANKLKVLGHRFPNTRAHYIVNSREFKDNIKEKLQELKSNEEKRNWLVENINGLGMKEASHFLRNIGYKDVAIIDFHIIDLLVKNNLIEKPKSKSLTKNNYIEIENTLKKLSSRVGINLDELDLYLWYQETGKVLK